MHTMQVQATYILHSTSAAHTSGNRFAYILETDTPLEASVRIHINTLLTVSVSFKTGGFRFRSAHTARTSSSWTGSTHSSVLIASLAVVKSRRDEKISTQKQPE